MAAIKLKDVKKGDYFTLKAIDEPNESQVYVRGDYVKGEKVYSCFKFEDVNHERFFKGDKVVYVDFIF